MANRSGEGWSLTPYAGRAALQAGFQVTSCTRPSWSSPMDAAKIILCVDDDEAVLLTQVLLLESAGFRVLSASSGERALEIFKAERVDAVVMDYRMPKMNGIMAAELMKRLKPYVPIVFLSAYSELPGETLGIAHWWAKKGEEPPEVFVARLRALVNESGARPFLAS